MADEDNPLEGAEFEAAIGKLEASSSSEMKALATVITALRDAVMDLQEQVYAGDDDEEDDGR
jgi:hypothetical protein